jgi:general secretion pathway protein B
MSFILDALKKSEVERQHQAIPGLMDSRPLPPRAKFPLWAVALIALLVVNMVVLAVVFLRGSAPIAPTQVAPVQAPPLPESAAPPAVGSTHAQSPPAPARNADHFSPMDTAPPVYAPEIPAAQERPTAQAPRPARAGSSADGVATRHDARLPDPVLTAQSAAADEVLPTINEINVAGQPALADLHLDVHVYATNPSERFVYINMRKYKEGATLAEGPVLESIRRDGVVLNYQGLRFVLPRQ